MTTVLQLTIDRAVRDGYFKHVDGVLTTHCGCQVYPLDHFATYCDH